MSKIFPAPHLILSLTNVITHYWDEQVHRYWQLFYYCYHEHLWFKIH